MFHKSEVGIWIANVWFIQIYIVMGAKTSWNQWKNSDEDEISAGKPPMEEF